MENVFLCTAGAAGLLLACAAASQAASYNFDFGTNAGAPAATYGAAGVAGIWNTTPSGAATGTGFHGRDRRERRGCRDHPRIGPLWQRRRRPP
jgi:hypothetical protein